MTRFRRILTLFAAFVFIAQASLQPAEVAAVDRGFYSANEVLYFDPEAKECSGSTTGGTITAETSITIEKTPEIETIWNYLTSTPLSTNGGKPLNPTQAAGIMGNMYVESGFNPSAIERTTRAEKGHGLVQWTFGRWYELERFAAQKGTAWDNLNTQLEYLKKELEGTEKAVITDSQFASTKDPAVAAMRFRIVFERADPDLAHDDKRTGAAIAVYKLFGGKGGDCTSATGAVVGDLVKTALNYALQTPATNGMTKESDARDTYRADKPKYNPSVDWTDCGGYIAVIMYASEVDKSFPNVSTTAQLAYARSNPSKYVVMNNPSLGDLQPGDMLYTSGHVTMYTGQATYPSVDASLNERVPSVRNSGSATWMINNGAVLVRVIK